MLDVIRNTDRIKMSIADLLARHGIKLESIAPGRYYTTCPHCSTTRKLANQNKKTLGVTINAEGAYWGCNHCHWTGPEKGNGNGRGGDNLITYDYADASGAVLFQKVRAYDKSGKKFFWLRRPDGHGGWIKGTKGVDTNLIYRLPEVIEAMALDRVIMVVEGEKDVDRLWSLGIPATCNAHGAPDVIQNPRPAPKWKPEHSEQLRGADLVVVPDNDPAGRYHADSAASLSRGIAKRIRLLDLAKHWSASPGGDVSDYLDAGHGREQLDALIEKAPDWVPSQAKTDDVDIYSVATLRTETFPTLKQIAGDIIVEGLTLLASRPKIGKTWLALDVAIAVAQGTYCLGDIQCEQGDVLFLALEDNKRRMQRRLTKLLGINKAEWPPIACAHTWPRADKGGLERIRQWIEQRRKTARLVVIDVLARFRKLAPPGKQSYDLDYEAIAELQKIALPSTPRISGSGTGRLRCCCSGCSLPVSRNTRSIRLRRWSR